MELKHLLASCTAADQAVVAARAALAWAQQGPEAVAAQAALDQAINNRDAAHAAYAAVADAKGAF